MALSDLKVFSEFLYQAQTEILAQQIDLFNDASRGAISLGTDARVGDFFSRISFQRVSGGLVRRRNAYGTGDVDPKNMSMLEDVLVKVASGTPPIEMNPGQWRWIQEAPEEAAAQMAQQLAVDTMADMLNTAVGTAAAAMQNNASVLNDVSGIGVVTTIGEFAGPLSSPLNLNSTAAKFGDLQSRIGVWVMHSKTLNDYYGQALQNAQRLYTYGSVNVVGDAFGRVFLVSDVPALLVAGSPNKYLTLGLVPGGIEIQQQNDFDDNWSELNGSENIKRTYQAEWSYMLGLKGYAWDKTAGGKSPTDAALMSGSNWAQYATSLKDTAGVVMLSK